MRKLTSKILGLFLPDVSAGACVIDFTCCCTPAKTTGVSCTGVCVRMTGCRTKAVGGFNCDI